MQLKILNHDVFPQGGTRWMRFDFLQNVLTTLC